MLSKLLLILLIQPVFSNCDKLDYCQEFIPFGLLIDSKIVCSKMGIKYTHKYIKYKWEDKMQVKKESINDIYVFYSEVNKKDINGKDVIILEESDRCRLEDLQNHKQHLEA